MKNTTEFDDVIALQASTMADAENEEAETSSWLLWGCACFFGGACMGSLVTVVVKTILWALFK